MKKFAIAALTLAFGLAAQAVIAHDRCTKCGCSEQLVKVCKAVPETKKVKSTVWECKCEDICIPGRTLTHDCVPTCGKSRSVRKLVKKEVTKEVPSFKWVQETVCVSCCDSPCGSRHHLGEKTSDAKETLVLTEGKRK